MALRFRNKNSQCKHQAKANSSTDKAQPSHCLRLTNCIRASTQRSRAPALVKHCCNLHQVVCAPDLHNHRPGISPRVGDAPPGHRVSPRLACSRVLPGAPWLTGCSPSHAAPLPAQTQVSALLCSSFFFFEVLPFPCVFSFFRQPPSITDLACAQHKIH